MKIPLTVTSRLDESAALCCHFPQAEGPLSFRGPLGVSGCRNPTQHCLFTWMLYVDRCLCEALQEPKYGTLINRVTCSGTFTAAQVSSDWFNYLWCTTKLYYSLNPAVQRERAIKSKGHKTQYTQRHSNDLLDKDNRVALGWKRQRKFLFAGLEEVKEWNLPFYPLPLCYKCFSLFKHPHLSSFWSLWLVFKAVVGNVYKKQYLSYLLKPWNRTVSNCQTRQR